MRYPATDEREFEALTAQHLAAVREAIEKADILIFTLGLTEAWISKADDAVFPACPGTIAGTFEPSRHAFRNFTARETAEDLQDMIGELRDLNPALKVILTVSPVPLVATAERCHVLVSTVASKAILRAAADEASRSLPDVAYFPAYEIVTGSQAPAEFFEADRRSVSPAGVDTVMQAFLAHCETGDHAIPDPSAVSEASRAIVEAECEELFAERDFKAAPKRVPADLLAGLRKSMQQGLVASPVVIDPVAQRSRVLVAGHSHGHALGIPQSRKSEPHFVAFDRAGYAALAGPERDRQYWQRLTDNAEGKHVALSFLGNQHNVLFFLDSQPPIDFLLADDPALEADPDRYLLAEARIRARLVGGLLQLGKLLERLGGRAERCYVLSPPPPRADTPALRETFAAVEDYSGFSAASAETASRAMITPAVIRRKLWLVVVEQTEKAARAGGAEFVPCPEAAMENGYLRDDLADDLTHGNAAFGAMMLDALDERRAAR